MFKSKSAWFSTSVSKACRDFWILQGGILAGWRSADYLFSADASCPDTKRVFESRDYLHSQVTVFHSSFLSSCKKRQSVKSVSIGHYVLPPAPVQEEVRDAIGRMIWEHDDEQPQSCVYHNEAACSEGEDEFNYSDAEPSSSESSEYQSPPCAHVQDCPVSKKLTGYISMDKLLKYSGDLRDFHVFPMQKR